MHTSSAAFCKEARGDCAEALSLYAKIISDYSLSPGASAVIFRTSVLLAHVGRYDEVRVGQHTEDVLYQQYKNGPETKQQNRSVVDDRSFWLGTYSHVALCSEHCVACYSKARTMQCSERYAMIGESLCVAATIDRHPTPGVNICSSGRCRAAHLLSAWQAGLALW